MPDQIETPGQGNPPASSAGQSAAAGGTPEGFVEKARLDGALLKIQELTLANRALADENQRLKSSAGDLQTTVTSKEAEWNAKAGEFQKLVQELQGKYGEAEKKLKEGEAEKLKLEALKAINRPDLIAVMDTVPVGPDLEATKASFLKIAQYADGIKKQREAELLAGVSGSSSSVASVQSAPAPTDDAGWMGLINSTPFGSPERQQAWEKYWAFTAQAQKS